MGDAAIVGREEELQALRALLDPDGLPAVAVVAGEAGIGKTTLWRASAADAERRGYRALVARPSEAETQYSFAALGDLLADVGDDVLATLPPPQRVALDAALLRVATTDAVEERAVAAGFLATLRALATASPVLVAIDDAQWLDAASLAVVRFAFARLSDDRVAGLFACRDDPPEWLRRILTDGAPGNVDVGPLSVGALHQLLAERLERRLARPLLLRVWQVSGGNPLFALELASALQRRGRTLAVGEELPVPTSLDALLESRLDGLGAALEVAQAVAALAEPTAELVESVVEPFDEGLREALEAGILELDGERLRFTHPLFGPVVAGRLTPRQQRMLHARLARFAPTTEQRARHLALATAAPDAAIAEALEDAATHARGRGTIIAAAELAEHALRLTPTDALEDRNRRTVAAGRAHLEAGEAGRARALALEVADTHASGRAQALVLLSDIEWWSNVRRAIELRREALAAAAEQPALQAEIHAWLGGTLHQTEGADRADEHAVTAVELADALGDVALHASALRSLAHGRFRAGRPDGMELVEQAQLAAAAAEPVVRREANMTVVHAAIWSHQLDRARTLLATIDREWSERDEVVRWEVLWWRGLTELRAGRFALAADYAERATEIGRQYTDDRRDYSAGAWLAASVAAHRGELEHARALATPIEALEAWPSVARTVAAAVLGHVELWSGNPDGAATQYAAADAGGRDLGIGEPAMIWWRAEHAEALLALGRLDEAAALLDEWEAQAAPLRREVVLAHVRRCRGLMAAAQGQLEEAVAELERAVAHQESLGDPFGYGRSLLALGIVRRRTRQKRAAREAIAAAAALFEECGAEGWAETARLELARIGGRAPQRDALTEAERRIAVLVAQGKTNREVAAALFVTEHSVENALTRIYRKLDVRSRTELAARSATP